MERKPAILAAIVAALLSTGGLSCAPSAEELGDASWAAGQPRQAMAHYAQAVARNPVSASLAQRLRNAQERFAEQLFEGQAEGSAEELAQLIDAARGRPLPWPTWRREFRRRLADLHLGEGRTVEAVQQHVALGRDWPDCPTCPSLAQAAALQLPGSPEGVAAYEELVRAWPRETLLHESFARWLADHGRLQRAEREYEKLLFSPAVAADLMLNARLQVALKLLRKKSNSQDLPGKTRPE